MPATLSSANSWTGLNTDLTAYLDTATPPKVGIKIAPADLANVPDEIRQMIRLVQDGWGANVGAGKKLDFWTAFVLLQQFLEAYGTQNGIPSRVPQVS